MPGFRRVNAELIRYTVLSSFASPLDDPPQFLHVPRPDEPAGAEAAVPVEAEPGSGAVPRGDLDRPVGGRQRDDRGVRPPLGPVDLPEPLDDLRERGAVCD